MSERIKQSELAAVVAKDKEKNVVHLKFMKKLNQ
jgi:hypothetical protein